MRARLAPQAIRDFRDIRAYLTRHSLAGAEHVRLSIRATIGLLEKFPAIAHATDIEGIRVVAVAAYPYVLYYRIVRKQIIIVHIRHSSRGNPRGELL